MNNLEDKIVEHLKEKYNPDAILLHGSRAIHKAKERSDWDFIMLFETVPEKNDFREEIENQNIEISVLELPPTESKIISNLGVKLQNARVVFDATDNGKKCLAIAKKFYAKGFTWPTTWPESAGLFMQSKIEGMIDNTDSQMIFQKHLSIFSGRALNFWFQLLHKKFSQPMYLAIETLKKEDPVFLSHLEALAAINMTNQEKIKHAQALHVSLFDMGIK